MPNTAKVMVSILVFLDTSVPGLFAADFARELTGFNPCFSGYLCSGIAKKKGDMETFRVSILVFLDTSVPGRIPSRGSRAALLCFNPCFSGYLCSGSGGNGSIAYAIQVSILVFLDTSVPGMQHGANIFCPSTFQSLFFWIPLFREDAELLDRPR